MFTLDTGTDAECNKRLRAILENTVDGIVVIDSRGLILSYNRACEGLFGYTAEEMLGQNVSALMPEPQRSHHNSYISHYLMTGETKVLGKGREVSGQKKNGKIFPLWLSLGEITEGEDHFFVGILSDLSEQARKDAQIRKYMLDLERSNRDLDDFVYIVSHDLKEPVRGLYSYSQFLLDDYGDTLDSAGQEKLQALMSLSTRIETLIDTLLTYSRLGRAELAFAETDLDVIVQDVLEMCSTFLRDNNATVRISAPLPTIVCDRARIGEIFHNLITNAVKYNDQTDKIVEIGVITDSPAEPGQCVFYVKDNGIGIPEKFHDAVFKMFKRLHAPDAYGGGTGSGLALVKKIVDRHNGKIWIESSEGQGTTFYFTLSSPNHNR